MPDVIKLKVDLRKITGRKVKQLRRDQILPGNIYGKGTKSVAVQLLLKDFKPVFAAAGETGIVAISVAKETKPRPVLIHNIHLDPVTDEFLHVDFHQVDLTQKVTVAVPIELTNEAPAVAQGGVLVQLLNEIEVEALPTDLPDKFAVDVSKLETIGQGITLKDLKVSDKVKLMVENLDELVVKIEAPAKEEEKPVEPEVPAEGEAPPAEGEAAPKEEEKPQPKADQPKAEKPEKK